VGSYVGVATLLDEHRQAIGDAKVTLASVGSTDGGWFGNVQADLAGLVRDGDRLVVKLPGGLEGRVRVTIDLTGEQPVIRLRGIGRSPI
jgi:hypothetical protein